MTEEEMLKLIPTPDWVNDFKFKDKDFIYHSDTILRILKDGVQKKTPIETCEELQSFVGEAIKWHNKHIPCCGKGFFFQEHKCQKSSPQEPLPWEDVSKILRAVAAGAYVNRDEAREILSRFENVKTLPWQELLEAAKFILYVFDCAKWKDGNVCEICEKRIERFEEILDRFPERGGE